MTAVGKILVFLNLLFSLLVSGFVVVVFVTRTNWRVEYQKAADVAKTAEAAYKAEMTQRKLDVDTEQARARELSRQVADLRAQLDTSKEDITRLEKDKVALTQEKELSGTTQNTSVAELDRIRKERDDLKKIEAQLQSDNIALRTQVNTERQKATEKEIAYKSSKDRNERLLQTMEDMSQRVRALEAQVRSVGGSTGNAMASSGTGASSPAILSSTGPAVPANLTGQITNILANGLTTISVGSDAGVQPGAELAVYRLVPDNPNASKFLGKLQIRQARAKEAVGQFIPATRDKAQIGDTVGTLSLGTR